MSISTSPPAYSSLSLSSSRRSSPKSKPHKNITLSKLDISRPISARPARKSSSISSVSSAYSSRSSSSSPSHPIDLEQRATQILNTLYNSHAPSSLAAYIHPAAHFTHEYVDEKQIPSRREYIAHWEQKLARFPAFSATVRECCVDESQGKVWVMSDVVCDQAGLRRRQVVDMLTFDAEGVLVEGNGFFRRMSSGRKGEEEGRE